MNPYLSGTRPHILASPNNAKRKIHTPQKLILPSIQNNANSKTSISSKNMTSFNVGSPRSSAYHDLHSPSNIFYQQNKSISEALTKSDMHMHSKRYPESALYQTHKSRFETLYLNQSPTLPLHHTRNSSIDMHESLTYLDKRFTTNDDSPSSRRKESPDFNDKAKSGSLIDSLEAISHQDTCNTSRLGATSARSPHDEVIIRPREPKASPKKKSKRVVTVDGRVKLEKTTHSVEASPKMSINIPGMSMKAVFSKDKETTRGSMDNLDSEREKFVARAPNRSLTEHITLKQREKEALNALSDLGSTSPRYKKDASGQLSEFKNAVDNNQKEFPVTFTPIRIKNEVPETSRPKVVGGLQEKPQEQGMTLAEYFSQEDEKKKQQRIVHETVADKVIEEECESNVSVMQEEQADVENVTSRGGAWIQRGNTFKKKNKYLF